MSLGLGLKLNTGSAAGSSGPVTIASIIPTATHDLDATVAESYTSGGTWTNLLGGGDYWRGTNGTTAAPTFVGTPGDPAAYFALSGAQYFQQKDSSGTIFHAMARTDQTSNPYWVAIAIYMGSVGSNYAFFGNGAAVGENAIRVLMNAGSLRFLQAGGTGTFNQVIASSVFSATTPTLLIVNFNSSSPGSETYTINADTGSSWGVAYSPNASTANCALPFQLCATKGTFIMPTGTRVYGHYAGTGTLTNDQIAALRDFLEARHSRTY